MKGKGHGWTTLSVTFDFKLLLALAVGSVPLGDDIAFLRVIYPIFRNENAEAVPIIGKERNGGQGNLGAERAWFVRNFETDGMGTGADRLIHDADESGSGNGLGIVLAPKGIVIAVESVVPLRLKRTFEAFVENGSLGNGRKTKEKEKNPSKRMVGASGFEPPASWPRTSKYQQLTRMIH